MVSRDCIVKSMNMAELCWDSLNIKSRTLSPLVRKTMTCHRNLGVVL